MSALTDLTIAQSRIGLEKREFSARELTDAHIRACEDARELNTLVAETFDLLHPGYPLYGMLAYSRWLRASV